MPLTDQQLDALRKAATATIHDGPWFAPPGKRRNGFGELEPGMLITTGTRKERKAMGVSDIRSNMPVCFVPEQPFDGYSRRCIRDYLLAADPSTILALLDDLADAKARLAAVMAEMRKDADGVRCPFCLQDGFDLPGLSSHIYRCDAVEEHAEVLRNDLAQMHRSAIRNYIRTHGRLPTSADAEDEAEYAEELAAAKAAAGGNDEHR